LHGAKQTEQLAESIKRFGFTAPVLIDENNCILAGHGRVTAAKPPVQSRFKPGQCGNPKGRPRGSRNRVPPAYEDNRLRAIIHEESNRMIAIQDANGKKTKITATRAVVKAITVSALKGHQRSQRLSSPKETRHDA
jgi:hypothetical protein